MTSIDTTVSELARCFAQMEIEMQAAAHSALDELRHRAREIYNQQIWRGRTTLCLTGAAALLSAGGAMVPAERALLKAVLGPAAQLAQGCGPVMEAWQGARLGALETENRLCQTVHDEELGLASRYAALVQAVQEAGRSIARAKAGG